MVNMSNILPPVHDHFQMKAGHGYGYELWDMEDNYANLLLSIESEVE